MRFCFCRSASLCRTAAGPGAAKVVDVDDEGDEDDDEDNEDDNARGAVAPSLGSQYAAWKLCCRFPGGGKRDDSPVAVLRRLSAIAVACSLSSSELLLGLGESKPLETMMAFVFGAGPALRGCRALPP